MTKQGTVPPTCDETEEPLVHTAKAAELLGVSQSRLENGRIRSKGPQVTFVKIARAIPCHAGTLRRLRGNRDE